MLFFFHSSIRYLDGIVLGITCCNKRQLLLNIIFFNTFIERLDYDPGRHLDESL